jgi:hypothetical protein
MARCYRPLTRLARIRWTPSSLPRSLLYVKELMVWAVFVIHVFDSDGQLPTGDIAIAACSNAARTGESVACSASSAQAVTR